MYARNMLVVSLTLLKQRASSLVEHTYMGLSMVSMARMVGRK